MKKIILTLLACICMSVGVQAQFTYTHSDGTVISCKKAPFRTLDDGEDIRTEYVEVTNKKIMFYTTYATVSRPKIFNRVNAEAVLLDNIAFDDQHFAILVQDTDENHPITIMLIYTSPQVREIYEQKKGVKSKLDPTPSTLATFEFATHKIGKDFVSEVISKLPANKQENAKVVFEKVYYGMAGEMQRQKDMKTRKEQATATNGTDKKQKLINDGNLIEINGQTFYMDGSAVYNSNFEAIGTRSISYLKFGQTTYNYKDETITKNQKPMFYQKSGTSGIFYDKGLKSAYLKVNSEQGNAKKYFILKDGKQIGYYKVAYMATSLAEVACLMDYLGL